MTNAVRGEIAVTVGDLELTLVADMNRLAAVSRETDRPSFRDLYIRLSTGEIDTVLSGLRNFVVKGRRGAEILDMAKTMEVLWPQIDIGKSIALGQKMTELLSALLVAKPDDAKVNPLGNGPSAPNQ